MSQLTQSEKDDLEHLIDKHTLESVLDALHEICHEKASHLRTNWQDNAAAKDWESVAKLISKASTKADENRI